MTDSADSAPVTVPELPIPSRAQAAALRNLRDGNPTDLGPKGRARSGHGKVRASIVVKKWAVLAEGTTGQITPAGEEALAAAERFEAQAKGRGA